MKWPNELSQLRVQVNSNSYTQNWEVMKLKYDKPTFKELMKTLSYQPEFYQQSRRNRLSAARNEIHMWTSKSCRVLLPPELSFRALSAEMLVCTGALGGELLFSYYLADLKPKWCWAASLSSLPGKHTSSWCGCRGAGPRSWCPKWVSGEKSRREGWPGYFSYPYLLCLD